MTNMTKKNFAKANLADKYLAQLAAPKIQMFQLDQIYWPRPTERLYSIEMATVDKNSNFIIK